MKPHLSLHLKIHLKAHHLFQGASPDKMGMKNPPKHDKLPINDNTHTHARTRARHSKYRHSQRESMTYSLLTRNMLLLGQSGQFYTNNQWVISKNEVFLTFLGVTQWNTAVWSLPHQPSSFFSSQHLGCIIPRNHLVWVTWMTLKEAGSCNTFWVAPCDLRLAIRKF